MNDLPGSRERPVKKGVRETERPKAATVPSKARDNKQALSLFCKGSSRRRSSAEVDKRIRSAKPLPRSRNCPTCFQAARRVPKRRFWCGSSPGSIWAAIQGVQSAPSRRPVLQKSGFSNFRYGAAWPCGPCFHCPRIWRLGWLRARRPDFSGGSSPEIPSCVG